MFSLAVAALASVWLVGAQETDNPGYHTHATFAFIRTGDRTPAIQPGPSVLTALGAQQMFQLGQNFRTRYIAGNAPANLGVERIAGMSTTILNNDQVLVQTLDSQHLVSSAQAFMQGLYPPQNIASGNSTRGASGGLLSNGTAIDFPLGGYQYANIQTASLDDPKSFYLAGTQSCPVAKMAAMKYFTTEKFMATKEANEDFYNKLDIDWFEGNLRKEQLDYIYALEINDYLQYQYAHNTTIYTALNNDTSYTSVLQKARTLADEEAYYLYGNTSTSPSPRAIAGQTLAAMLLFQFQILIADKSSPGNNSDISYPLTLLFGDHEPLISLLTLFTSNNTHPDPAFRSLPPLASSAIFELYSMGSNASFPTSKKDLYVRFYFHNGTADYAGGQLNAFPFLGNGVGTTGIAWSEFEQRVGALGMASVKEWCEVCDSASYFCEGVEDGRLPPSTSPKFGDKKHGQRISLAVAGVLGAVVTLGVAGVLFGLAAAFLGVRVHRVQRGGASQMGGFKGSAKLASDADVSIVKNAAAPAGISFVPDAKRGHERVGSWELRNKEFGGQRRPSFDAIDEVAKPVRPDERV
ncbi:histidine phosphatase superfamily [Phaeosphaeriaceae sp. PMI808]|nr:histidine phosphatase superfamily [Phaeosphaeriaceae sp. PMI808]